nr:PetL [Madagascaria erythrocladioides]
MLFGYLLFMGVFFALSLGLYFSLKTIKLI